MRPPMYWAREIRRPHVSVPTDRSVPHAGAVRRADRNALESTDERSTDADDWSSGTLAFRQGQKSGHGEPIDYENFLRCPNSFTVCECMTGVGPDDLY
jgi:hypothetical protein